MKVKDFLPEFIEAFEKQLDSDEIRWGDTWLKRPRAGQVKRIYERFDAYNAEYYKLNKPIPWTKIAGEALIGWIRDNYPELFVEERDE